MLLVLATTAEARLTTPATQAVGASPPANAQIPLSLTLQDERGVPQTLQVVTAHTPSVLILADYACQTLCGPIVSLAAGALERSGLQAGRDYRLVVVSLDPQRGPREAKAMKAAQIGEGGELVGASSFLSADVATLQQLATALGYRSIYDEENAQFAHPAVVFVLTADGRVPRSASVRRICGWHWSRPGKGASDRQPTQSASYATALILPPAATRHPFTCCWLWAGCSLPSAWLSASA
jgi:protein SCO1/2